MDRPSHRRQAIRRALADLHKSALASLSVPRIFIHIADRRLQVRLRRVFLPALSFSSSTHFCTMATPGCTPYNEAVLAAFAIAMAISPADSPPTHSSAALLWSCEIPDAFEHRPDDQRQRHRGIIEDFGEAPTFFRRDKLAPRNGFRVRAAAEAAPMDRLRTNAHAVVVALQRDFLVAAPRKQFRVNAELL